MFKKDNNSFNKLFNYRFKRDFFEKEYESLSKTSLYTEQEKYKLITMFPIKRASLLDPETGIFVVNNGSSRNKDIESIDIIDYNFKKLSSIVVDLWDAIGGDIDLSGYVSLNEFNSSQAAQDIIINNKLDAIRITDNSDGSYNKIEDALTNTSDFPTIQRAQLMVQQDDILGLVKGSQLYSVYDKVNNSAFIRYMPIGDTSIVISDPFDLVNKEYVDNISGRLDELLDEIGGLLEETEDIIFEFSDDSITNMNYTISNTGGVVISNTIIDVYLKNLLEDEQALSYASANYINSPNKTLILNTDGLIEPIKVRYNSSIISNIIVTIPINYALKQIVLRKTYGLIHNNITDVSQVIDNDISSIYQGMNQGEINTLVVNEISTINDSVTSLTNDLSNAKLTTYYEDTTGNSILNTITYPLLNDTNYLKHIEITFSDLTAYVHTCSFTTLASGKVSINSNNSHTGTSGIVEAMSTYYSQIRDIGSDNKNIQITRIDEDFINGNASYEFINISSFKITIERIN